MPMTPATHAYVGTKTCGCTVAVVSDMPELLDDTAKTVYGFLLDGLAVTRVPCDQVGSLFQPCPHQVVVTVPDTPQIYEIHHFVRSYVLATDEEDVEDIIVEQGDAITEPMIYNPSEAYLRPVSTVPDTYLDTYPLTADDEPRTCREILADIEMVAKQIPLSLE